jgi:hypothetical protein
MPTDRPDPIRAMSDGQLERAYDRLLNSLDWSYSGSRYGWDWPTMRMIEPGIYNSIQRIGREYRRRHPLPTR